MRSIIIFALLAAAMLMPAVAYAQERGPTREEIIQSRYSGPVFLDAYWTSGSSGNQTGKEVDVGPGDGASTLAVVLINRGPSDIAGITGRLSLPGDFQATGKSSGAQAVATFNQIAAVGNPFTLFFDVSVLDSADVGEYTARLSVDYSRIFETGAPRTAEIDVPFRVTGDATLVLSRIAGENQSSTQIEAGKIRDYSFSVANTGTAPITNVIITLASQSESLEILGDSKWDVQRIEQDSQAELATQVFAANSLIGNPASFDVTIEYSSNGEPHTEKFTLGTYVAGEISITAYEIEVNYIGGTPNIVGNLLNEGNTVALFTTIEVVSAGDLVSSLPPSQYLGDLEENSPLPFSIPINVGSAGAGTYPVSLQVTYKDNLRELHTFDIDAQVEFAPEQPADESGQNNGMGMALPIGIGITIAIAIGVGVALSRRKKASIRRTIQSGKQDEDIESVLDSHSRKDDRR